MLALFGVFLLDVAVLVTLCFAAPLTYWKHMGPGKATFYSFFAVIRTARPFLVLLAAWFGIFFGVCILAALVFGDAALGRVVLMWLIFLFMLLLHQPIHRRNPHNRDIDVGWAASAHADVCTSDTSAWAEAAHPTSISRLCGLRRCIGWLAEDGAVTRIHRALQQQHEQEDQPHQHDAAQRRVAEHERGQDAHAEEDGEPRRQQHEERARRADDGEEAVERRLARPHVLPVGERGGEAQRHQHGHVQQKDAEQRQHVRRLDRRRRLRVRPRHHLHDHLGRDRQPGDHHHQQRHGQVDESQLAQRGQRRLAEARQQDGRGDPVAVLDHQAGLHEGHRERRNQYDRKYRTQDRHGRQADAEQDIGEQERRQGGRLFAEQADALLQPLPSGATARSAAPLRAAWAAMPPGRGRERTDRVVARVSASTRARRGVRCPGRCTSR
ncbi:conserved hypothetical protein [Ricinus communis]|uniref:Uncharacterized protein n=1 Tax=Ricinus communis TaxID=3988 RepID=B9TEK6_RICCO|nr:conserved hypothetical protein [Ricinus communis]